MPWHHKFPLYPIYLFRDRIPIAKIMHYTMLLSIYYSPHTKVYNFSVLYLEYLVVVVICCLVICSSFNSQIQRGSVTVYSESLSLQFNYFDSYIKLFTNHIIQFVMYLTVMFCLRQHYTCRSSDLALKIAMLCTLSTSQKPIKLRSILPS